MFLKNNFDAIKFSLLTILHIAIAFYIFDFQNIEIITFLFIGFISNQLLLIYGVSQLTNSKAQPSASKLIGIFIGKFIILALAITCALQNLGKNSGYALIFYIFQLIILVISIKRNTKKIKD